MKNQFAPEVKTAVFDAIQNATQTEGGRITQKDLAALFPELGCHKIESNAGYRDIDTTTRQIRAVIAEIDMDARDPRLICQDNRGYFVPTTLAEVSEYAARVEHAGSARIDSTLARMNATHAKHDAFKVRQSHQAAMHLQALRQSIDSGAEIDIRYDYAVTDGKASLIPCAPSDINSPSSPAEVPVFQQRPRPGSVVMKYTA